MIVLLAGNDTRFGDAAGNLQLHITHGDAARRGGTDG